MKLTPRLIRNLRQILQGESIPYSNLPKSLADPLVAEGLLNVIYHGSRRSLRTHNADALAGVLPRYNEALSDLDAAESMISDDNSRAMQASISGDSKTIGKRSSPGFLVNTFHCVECMLNDETFIINPPEGSAVYIADWRSFIPPITSLVIGVENMENFLKIRNHGLLFDNCLTDAETDIIFIARYAFSSDISRWLEQIPNRYLHFGDFDLAGIDIFLNQFKPHVEERGSFFIPSDISNRISRGSRKRYNEQFLKYSHLTAADDGLSSLIALIHRYRRTYDQEGYIKTGNLLRNNRGISEDDFM